MNFRVHGLVEDEQRQLVNKLWNNTFPASAAIIVAVNNVN